MQIFLIVIWVLAIVLFLRRAIQGWSYFFQIRDESWTTQLPLVSQFSAKGMPTPVWWHGKTKTPLVWFRDKLLGLTLAVIPFNILSLIGFAGNYFGFIPPMWKTEYSNMWLILTLLAGWISGGSIYGQCLYSERLLRRLRQG